jgi:SH3-like domain-containing protein
MKRLLWQCALAAFIMGMSGVQGQAQTPAVVNADRVNVRSRPAMNGEVVAQLRRGQEVVILEEGLPSRDRDGEITEWTRIQLPAETRVWVSAGFLDADTGAVKTRRLNARSGPSEDFGVLGTLDRGVIVQKLGETNGWWEITAPPGLHAFVAAEFLDASAEPAPTVQPAQPGGTPKPSAATEPTPPAAPSVPGAATPTEAAKPASPQEAPPPQPTAQALAEPKSVVEPQEAGRAAPKGPDLPPTPPAAPVGIAVNIVEMPALEEAAGPRVVRRQGRLSRAFSIQAPTDYELRSTDDGELLNYIIPASTNVNVRQFRGQIVIVAGPVEVDARWPNTPIMQVERIQLAP